MSIINKVRTAVSRTVERLVRRAPHEEFWEQRFNELATYNSEVSRGLCHTPEWKERMAKMQADYHAKMQRRYTTPG